MMPRGAVRLFAPLIGANLAVWAVALVLFGDRPVLLGTALLAYSLGLRHAVDADHIAAIDNVTRKLVQTGRSSHATGLYFSLGHSAVVWLASLGIALAATAVTPGFAAMREVGGTIGTSVSALFLLGIAAVNLIVLKGLVGALRRQRQGQPPDAGELDTMLAPRGVYTRLLKPVFRLVSRSRHMFAIGFLFGLGFDTATEIGVLGISAAAAGHGIGVWTILIFPALFTAGMALVDTADSVLMTRAYGWAFVQPARKLYYNLAVTFASVIVALLVGGIEVLSLLPTHADLGHATSGLGYAIIAAFALLWLGAMALARHRTRTD